MLAVCRNFRNCALIVLIRRALPNWAFASKESEFVVKDKIFTDETLLVRRGSETNLKLEAAVLAPLPNGQNQEQSRNESPLPPGLLDGEAKVSNHRRWSFTAPPSDNAIAQQIEKIEKEVSRDQQIQQKPSSFRRDGPARRSAVTDAERWLQNQYEQQRTGPSQSVSEESEQHSDSLASSRSVSPAPPARAAIIKPSEALGYPTANELPPSVKVCTVTGEQYETVKLKQEPGALGIHVIPRVLQENKM